MQALLLVLMTVCSKISLMHTLYLIQLASDEQEVQLDHDPGTDTVLVVHGVVESALVHGPNEAAPSVKRTPLSFCSI